MRNLVIVIVLAGLPTAGHAQTPVPPAPTLSATECAVWARENSFARSVAAHDKAAFAAHLHPRAVFGAKQPQPARGSDAIAQRWAGLIEGRTLRLQWYPAMVAVVDMGDEGDIAYSSGPALYEAVDPKARPRYRIGAFQSVWHQGTDGVWRVLFDDGIEPQPATEAEVEAFHAGRRAVCPQG